MATLHVRNVPDPLYAALRECAEQAGRSIGAQTIELLGEALLPDIARIRRHTLRRGMMRRPLFHRFTPKGREVMRFAQDEARELAHDYVGTEHILLGLLRMGDSVAARSLRGLGLDERALRAQIVSVVGAGSGSPPGQLRFTPRAKKVLELALRESLTLRHDYIGTEHLLLAIVSEGEGVAAEALRAQGVEESHVRAAVASLFAGGARFEMLPVEEEPRFLAVDLDGDAPQWTEQLNGLAADGWELVSLQQLGDATRAVLRRGP